MEYNVSTDQQHCNSSGDLIYTHEDTHGIIGWRICFKIYPNKYCWRLIGHHFDLHFLLQLNEGSSLRLSISNLKRWTTDISWQSFEFLEFQFFNSRWMWCFRFVEFECTNFYFRSIGRTDIDLKSVTRYYIKILALTWIQTIWHRLILIRMSNNFVLPVGYSGEPFRSMNRSTSTNNCNDL